MKPHRSRTMRLLILMCQLGLILRCEAQTPRACIGETFRPPRNSDINVTCGTEHMQMTIYLCPVYHANYNETLIAMNGVFDKPQCFGIPDWNADPPLLTFNFSITERDPCNNFFKVTNEVGTGMFADFSKVQHVNISGTLSSLDPSGGTITYRPQILYMFSCKYPMQYVVNNTELGVSGVSLAIKDNNGTFISTLSMHLYGDSDYTEALIVPDTGLNLKTKIFVAVKATNLTDKFHVLLDRCYATTLPFPTNSTYYDLFVGCTRDPQTVMDMNGEDQKAHFSFEAFRFVSHKNMTVSTFYLHCITRLCEVSNCATLKPTCPENPSRRRRAAVDENMATVSSPPIIVNELSDAPATAHGTFQLRNRSPVVGLIAAVVILAVLFVAVIVMFGLYLRKKNTLQYFK